jgi:hypothetical protein
MPGKTKWEVTGQVKSVKVGQKQDEVQIGKDGASSKIIMESGDSKGLKINDKCRVTVEIDLKLDFGEDED